MSKLREILAGAALLTFIFGLVGGMHHKLPLLRSGDEEQGEEWRAAQPPTFSITRAEWSADERLAVTLARGSILGSPVVVHDLRSQAAPWPIDLGGENVGTLALSPDGRHLLVGMSNGTAIWISLESSEQIILWQTSNGEPAISAAKISRDGGLAIVATTEGDIIICDTTGRHAPQIWKGHVGNINAIDLSGDKQRLLTMGMDGSAVVWDLNDRRELARLGQGVPLLGGAFIAGGREVILLGSLNAPVRKINIETGRTVWESEANPHGWLSLSLSADGTMLAAADFDKKITLWEARTGVKRRELIGHTKAVPHMRFSSDGRKLLSAGYDGTVLVWDTITGRVASHIDCDWMADTAL